MYLVPKVYIWCHDLGGSCPGSGPYSPGSSFQWGLYPQVPWKCNKCRNIFWLATTAREHQTARRLKHTLILSEKEAYVSILELWPKEKISYLLQVQRLLRVFQRHRLVNSIFVLPSALFQVVVINQKKLEHSFGMLIIETIIQGTNLHYLILVASGTQAYGLTGLYIYIF